MADRPNILFITSDQHRSDHLGCAGHPFIRTPHLDQIAFEGVRFTNAYSDCPVCIPARTTIITGVQSHIYGSPHYNAGFVFEREREKYLGALMTAAGYQTQLVGKTHWHTPERFRAGFEHVETFAELSRQRKMYLGRAWGQNGLGANELWPGLSAYPPGLCSTDWAVDRAIDFVDRRDDTCPFFLWLSVTDPHPPIVIHEPYYSMYDDADIPLPAWARWADPDRCPYAIHAQRRSWNSSPMPPHTLRKARGVYAGMITNIDYQLGRLFGYLQAHGLWDDTVVVYTTDHGEHLGDFGNIGKQSFLECSANLPFIVRPTTGMRQRWGVEPGRTVDGLVELADLLPTFCELGGCGDVVPDDVTGTSFVPLLSGQAASVRDTLHGQINQSHLFHDGRYKYLYFTDDGRELVFDKPNDPLDLNDLSGDRALTSRLRERFIEHLRDEGHEDLSAAGGLRNDGRAYPPDHDLKARAPLGWPGGFRR